MAGCKVKNNKNKYLEDFLEKECPKLNQPTQMNYYDENWTDYQVLKIIEKAFEAGKLAYIDQMEKSLGLK